MEKDTYTAKIRTRRTLVGCALSEAAVFIGGQALGALRGVVELGVDELRASCGCGWVPNAGSGLEMVRALSVRL